MPIYDHEGLAALLTSRHAAVAVQEITRRADEAGFGRSMASAFAKLLPDESHEGRPQLSEEDVIEALSYFEMQGHGSSPLAHEQLSAYINRVAGMTRLFEKIDDSEATLLAAREGNGAFAVTDPSVLGHIQEVDTLIVEMGARYLQDPELWTRLVRDVESDLGMMASYLRMVSPREDTNPYDQFLALTRITNDLIKAVRASDVGGTEGAAVLERLSFTINRALTDGDYHDVMQHALEAWVRAVELRRPFDAYREALNPEVAEVVAFEQYHRPAVPSDTIPESAAGPNDTGAVSSAAVVGGGLVAAQMVSAPALARVIPLCVPPRVLK